MKFLNKNRKNKLLIPMVLTLSALVTNAYAVVITVEGDRSVRGGTVFSETDSIDTNISTENSVSILTNLVNPIPRGPGAYFAEGNENGSFTATTRGSEIFSINSSVNYVDTIFNTSGGEQSYTYSFDISRSSLSVNPGLYTTLTASDSVKASYNFYIAVNGIAIFNSSALLEVTQSGSQFTQSGTDIGFTKESTGISFFPGSEITEFYATDGFQAMLDLGTFNDGESFSLSYGVTVSGSSTARGGSLFSGELFSLDPARSSARFGDPSGLNSSSITASPVTTGVPVATSVPEASSIFILGFGLLGLVGFKRKKQI